MNSFLIGLQFLTRIRIVKQDVWTDKDFGHSVAYFPIVGMVIGAILMLIYGFLSPLATPFLLATLLVIAEFLLTGGLHADGLMDTCDGYFSGRDRERCLAIMKDSRVGSNGVVAFVFLVLLKIALFSSLMDFQYMALLAMPVLGRWAMSLSVIRFPYARRVGIGKAFADFAPSYALSMTSITALLPALYFGWLYLVPAAVSLMWCFWANRQIVKKLGGVTGDTYGAVTETTELWVLFAVLLVERFNLWNIW